MQRTLTVVTLCFSFVAVSALCTGCFGSSSRSYRSKRRYRRPIVRTFRYTTLFTRTRSNASLCMQTKRSLRRRSRSYCRSRGARKVDMNYNCKIHSKGPRRCLGTNRWRMRSCRGLVRRRAISRMRARCIF